ncbi:O-antigen ligase family protein [Bdellovibrio bacteriovorus]|uniref:O-antigen ligase family protein n=1 Tax=Bdellovibrio bacteriovorus TaxID=959 RepID=UPI003D07FC78
MDILNITTITALLLLLRTIELKHFFERISLSQILSGTILAFTPALLLLFLISFNLNPDAVSYFSTVYLDFLSTNIDYNVIAFLLLLSLNSLLFCKFSNVTVLTLSTLISMGILYSSSRRAFIILALLIPASFLLRFIFGQRKGIAVAFGIILSSILTIGVVFYALAFPIKNNKVATATVQPLLRPLSLFLIPEDFNKLHYKIIFQIENHKKYNTDDVTFSRSVGELALAPRQSRIESAKKIIRAFKPTHHLFGHSFHLRTFGIAHDTKLDYPHNFLISTYLSTGLLGLFLNIFVFVLAFLGFWKERNKWGWEPTMAFSITILFSLTSGFSQWSFLPLALYLTIGLVAFFKSPPPASLTK